MPCRMPLISTDIPREWWRQTGPQILQTSDITPPGRLPRGNCVRRNRHRRLTRGKNPMRRSRNVATSTLVGIMRAAWEFDERTNASVDLFREFEK
mmetsp:Transcript_7825/g.15631  ORF Transcript_7825/g.15631 Transcript_7825/m.15631 type:complete len:95 (+) Transcript_7825:409-693(+)